MKILLIGECYSENLGDAVICETVKRLIEDKYETAEITLFDMSGRTDFNEYYKMDFKNLKLRIWRKILLLSEHRAFVNMFLANDVRYMRALQYFERVNKKKYDLVIFAGGALFMDFFAGVIYYIVKRVKCDKGSVLFHACGMGELSNESIFLLNETFRNPKVESISLRDSYKRFIRMFDVNNKTTETYDIALNCNKFYAKNTGKQVEYGIGVIGIEKYFDIQRCLVKNISETSVSWKIFTNGAPADEVMAKKILKSIGIREDEYTKYLAERPLDPNDLIDNISGFKKIISWRMHSQIIASAYGIQSIGVVWDDKIKEFYNKLGFRSNYILPERVLESKDDLDQIKMDEIKLRENVLYCSEYSKNVLFNQINEVLV